jgi:hypothetical protein
MPIAGPNDSEGGTRIEAVAGSDTEQLRSFPYQTLQRRSDENSGNLVNVEDTINAALIYFPWSLRAKF